MSNANHYEHQELIASAVSQLGPIFEESEQAIYVYHDDTHKACNKKFASLLGYDSPEEWAKTEESFSHSFVDDGSQATLVNAYQNAMDKLIGASLKVVWKKKSGETVETNVILVPASVENHLVALHFVV